MRDGVNMHLVDGVPHHPLGPAKVHQSGKREYFYHGKLHRNNGPAVIHPDGKEEYYQHGMKVTKHQAKF